MLWANSADNKLMIFFLFFLENRIWHFMQIVSWGESVRSYFLGKTRKKISKCCLLKFLPSNQSVNYWPMTFKVPVTTAAEDFLNLFVFYFLEKIRLDVFMWRWYMWHIKPYFCGKKKLKKVYIYLRMLSAAVWSFLKISGGFSWHLACPEILVESFVQCKLFPCPSYSFGAKFQTTFVVCFFLLANFRFKRSLYVKLKDLLSNSVDPDEMTHYELSPAAVKELMMLK